MRDSPNRSPLLESVTRSAVLHPYRYLLPALLLVAVCGVLAAPLLTHIHSDFAELLPSDMPSVAQVRELGKRVGGTSTVLVNIESLDGAAGLGRAEQMVPVIAQELMALGPQQIRGIETSMAPIRDWYLGHWPLFATVEQLQAARAEVRARVKKETVKANPFAVDLDEPEAAPAEPAPQAPVDATPASPAVAAVGSSSLDPAALLDPAKPSPRQRIAEAFAGYVDGYMVHPDHSSLTLIVHPASPALGVSESEALLAKMQQAVDKHAGELREHKLRVGFAGSVPGFLAEYVSVIGDVVQTAVLVTALVLLSIALFFFDVRSVLSLGGATMVAVALTFGFTRVTIGYLNTQTAFLGSIVIGNGINYGLIYLARVRQLRHAGQDLLSSCLEGASTTARSTLLASAATSVSYGVLVIAANRGFRHFGIIGGVGMLLCWLATFSLVPALLSICERVSPVRPRAKATVEAVAPGWLRRRFGSPWSLVVGFAVLTLASGALFLHRLPTALERNLANLGNEIRGHEDLRRDEGRAQTSLGRSIAGSVALLDSWPQADEFCEQIRKRARNPKYAPVVQGCDTLSSVVPREQEQKLALLREIGAELSDARLAHMAVAEQARLKEIRADLLAQGELNLEQAPHTLLDRFRERDGSLGHLAVVTARGDARLEEGPRLQAFVEAVRDVPVDGKLANATGDNVIFADLLRDIEKEGPRTTLLSFLGVCVCVLLIFGRDVRASVEVVGVLSVGVLLMAGAATLTGIKINFFNFIAYPITFGIAVDYGANVAVRAKERGGRVLDALAEVGPAVALCSWTTMVGYGSLILSLNRALRSFGWYAILGEVTTVATALLLLPALLLIARRSRPDQADRRDPLIRDSASATAQETS